MYKKTLLILIIVVIGFVLYDIMMAPKVINDFPLPLATSSGAILNSAAQKTDIEWKQILTPEQYHVLREQGTEAPFTGTLLNEHRKGTFYSVGCDEAVFRSEQKYESGTGWPSFWAPINADALVLKEDKMLGETRIEVQDKCGGHLGHVFDDGPQPTGKRYCMNSVALYFVPDEK